MQPVTAAMFKNLYSCNARDFRRDMKKYVDHVRANPQDGVVLMRHGRPSAYIISPILVEEINALVEDEAKDAVTDSAE